MNEKDKPTFHFPFNVKEITSPMIVIIIVTSILFVSSFLILSQNQTAVAQQQLQQEGQALASKGVVIWYR